MPRIKNIVQDLRSSFYGHDSQAFEDTVKRLEKLGDIEAKNGCTRGDDCHCNRYVKDVCMFRENKK